MKQTRQTRGMDKTDRRDGWRARKDRPTDKPFILDVMMQCTDRDITDNYVDLR